MNPIKTIWLVDDDPIFVYLTLKMMNKEHLAHLIEVFENGQQALDQLKHLSEQFGDLPQVIFLDLMMPVLDGWGFLDEYAELDEMVRRKIKIYVLSSSKSPQDIHRAKEIKVICDFITKPLSKSRFSEIVKNLGNKRLTIEGNL